MSDGEYKSERPPGMAAGRLYGSCLGLTFALLSRFQLFVVVLLVVDLLAVLVLFLIDLLLLLLGQCAAVRGTLVVNLLSDVGLVLVGPGRFARSHLAAAQPVGSALLLVGFPVVDFVRLHGIPVVLFVVDLTAGGILLIVDLLPLLTRELATIRLPVVVYLLVNIGLRVLSPGRFAG